MPDLADRPRPSHCVNKFGMCVLNSRTNVLSFFSGHPVFRFAIDVQFLGLLTGMQPFSLAKGLAVTYTY